MDTRTRILQAATELIARSPSGDVSTRAVCEAAGVGAPALYRQFGDKEGLLAAVVDHAFEAYLATKRAAVRTDDPVADLRAGWDNHVAFGLANPSYYLLMHSPAVRTPPAAAEEVFRMLKAVLDRCAAAGRLRVSTDVAAQMIMTANVGTTLLLIRQPEVYTDPALSHRVRDAVHAAVLAPPTGDTEHTEGEQSDIGRHATGLAALLRRFPAEQLSNAEAALLQEWLARLSDGRPAARESHSDNHADNHADGRTNGRANSHPTN